MEAYNDKDNDNDFSQSSPSNPSNLAYSRIMKEKIAKTLNEASTLCEEGDPDLAIAKLTRAIALQPENPDLFKLRAEAYILLSNYEHAIINFQKVIALQPNENDPIIERLADMYHQYGEVLHSEGKHTEALKSFKACLKCRPGNKAVTMKSVNCLMTLEKYAECMEMVKQELDADDTDPELFILRAKLNLLFGNTTAGYHDVCSALECNPTHKVAMEMKTELEKKALHYKSQAIKYGLIGRKLDSLKKISLAIKTDPAVAEYHVLRGALYRRVKDFNAAIDDFIVAMDKVNHQQDCEVYKDASRQIVLAYNDFAMECFKQHHYTEAVVLLKKAIKEEKKEKGLYLNRGDCFYRMNDLHFALLDYQQALELEPGDWDVSCRISIVCSELGVESYSKGHYSEAHAHFSAAVKHNPKVSRFYVCRAKARHSLKDISGTKEDILSALILDPDNEECLSLIARVLPGKTKTELINSYDATLCEEKLRTEFKDLSTYSQKHQDPLKNSTSRLSSKITQHLVGLNLRFSDNFESVNTSTLLDTEQSTCDTVDICGQSPRMGESSIQKNKLQKDSIESGNTENGMRGLQADNSLNKDTGANAQDSKELSVRQWSVLSHPLPELSSHQHRVPSQRDCLQEHTFHKMIYYSKKNCTEEVHRVLMNPTNICPPVKLNDTFADQT